MSEPTDRKPNHLFYFGWPSNYGGADTKAAHLLELLAGHIPITVIPNHHSHIENTDWTSFLDRLGIEYCPVEDLPLQVNGVALAMCNGPFFSDGLFNYALERNLPIIWSSEMSWMHPMERKLIEYGYISRLLYVSEVQKKALDYESFSDVPTRITGNYINPDHFPFVSREQKEPLTIGRLSRADPVKYPENFPRFYEDLNLENVRFRVMAWGEELQKLHGGHAFDNRWELLEPNAETAVDFLTSLDLFVYPLGENVIESWGRSTVEAMLTGAIPIVPNGHHFPNLMIHGESGFLCDGHEDFKLACQDLQQDFELRSQISRTCQEHARSQLCNADEHRRIWLDALDVQS